MYDENLSFSFSMLKHPASEFPLIITELYSSVTNPAPTHNKNRLDVLIKYRVLICYHDAIFRLNYKLMNVTLDACEHTIFLHNVFKIEALTNSLSFRVNTRISPCVCTDWLLSNKSGRSFLDFIICL